MTTVCKNTTVIRQAQKKDAQTVFELICALAKYHGENADFRATLADVERDGFGKNPIYESWLAEVAGIPQGLATFFLTYSTFKGKPCLLLDNLFVHDDMRGRGLGEKLMQQIIQRADELNCWRVELHVEKSNSARSFYEKFGFIESQDRVYIITAPEYIHFLKQNSS